MAFVPRTFSEILADSVAYVEANSDLTAEVGSAVRTFLEAGSLELDEGYFQMTEIMNAASINTATGDDLDERAADWDVRRLQPAQSSGEIVVRDGTLERSALRFDETTGATTIEVEDSTEFPTVGFPYTVRLGEGTPAVEDVSVTANDTGTNTLTTGALLNAHSAGETVSLVDGAPDVTIAAGLQVRKPASGEGDLAITFTTTEDGTLVNGNYSSTPIRARSTTTGADANVGTGRVTEFSSAAPFDGASVTNLAPFDGGRGLETDAELRGRLQDQIQALSTGNLIALKQAVLGVQDETTGQRVVTANVLEDFGADEVRVLVDDGTGFTPDQVTFPESTLAAAVLVGAGSIRVADPAEFSREGFAIVSPENAAQIELVEWTDVDYVTGVLTLSGVTANAHDSGDRVLAVEVLDDDAEPGRNFWDLGQYAIVRNSDRMFLDQGAGQAELVRGTDYVLNRGTGQLEVLGAGVAQDSVLVAHYDHYTGLLQTAQRTLNGDDQDPVTFPGVRPAGVVVLAETPTIRRVRVRASITAAKGFEEDALRPLVREAIEVYVNELGIGQDVIRAEIIERGMAIPGVYNMTVSQPTSDLSILEDELPLPAASDGSSLVEVL